MMVFMKSFITNWDEMKRIITADSILWSQFQFCHMLQEQEIDKAQRLRFLAYKDSCAFCSHLHTMPHWPTLKNVGTVKKSPPRFHRPSTVWSPVQWSNFISHLFPNKLPLIISTGFLYPTQIQLFLCFLILTEQQEIAFHLYLNLKFQLSHSSPHKSFFYELSLLVSERTQ